MAERVRTFEEYVEDSKKLIGFPVDYDNHGVVMVLSNDPKDYQVYTRTVDLRAVRQFCFALGDNNPLYTDPVYGRRTRWGIMLAHPSFIGNLRYNMWRGGSASAHYACAQLVAGFGWEYNDVIRLGDGPFETSFYAKDVVVKKGSTGPLCFTYSHAGYWNQYKELVATGRASNCMIGRNEEIESILKGEGVRNNPIYNRKTYHYSEEEIKKIVEGIEGEKRRGATPRYWEDIKVGDMLTPIVRGPLTTTDLMGYDAATSGLAVPSFGLVYRILKEASVGLGAGETNSITGWPYEWMSGHYDWDASKSSGVGAPYDIGRMRADITASLLSNWMGDDGFIRRFDVQFRKPNFWGDTQWFNAEVTKKYRDKVGEEDYGAVDIKITCTNEVGEVSAPGTATVYLPSIHEPIKLPVPHDDKYEEYEKFVKDCQESAARRPTFYVCDKLFVLHPPL